MTETIDLSEYARRNARLAAHCHQRAVWARAAGDLRAAEIWTTSALDHQLAASVFGAGQ